MTKEAMAAYNQAVRRDPKSARVYNLRGDAYRREGRYHLAIQDYDEAVRLAPQSAESYAGRAFAYTLLSKDKEAQQDAARAVELGIESILLEREIEELIKRR
jgi:tetratricopeptide (TPR) repeat protein